MTILLKGEIDGKEIRIELPTLEEQLDHPDRKCIVRYCHSIRDYDLKDQIDSIIEGIHKARLASEVRSA